MSEETGQGEAQSRPKVTLSKQIIPFEESNPAEEPLFINYAQVAHAGGSYYIDVGVIPLDDMLSSSEEARFLVLNRLVMSKDTIVGLAQQIQALTSNTDERAVDIATD